MTSRDASRTFDPAVVEALRSELDDDALLRDITGTFLTRAPDHISTLASAQQAGDLRTVSATAHLIKGSALTFGAERLGALCAILEARPVEANTLIGAVEQEYAELSRALVTYLDSLV